MTEEVGAWREGKTMEQNILADPWRASALADAALERAAQELKALLEALASALQPFPSFQGLQTVRAVEIELQGLSNPQRGCVVVCPDGLLYELTLRSIQGADEYGEADQADELAELDLKPQEYVAYA
ncbi:MAG: hypothetical protein HY532_02140, partial [Chloroflexi bacterium]|nr:hypothetical protein [Chloroflexota bacterium]